MRVLSVTWNPETDETKVRVSEEFSSSDWTVRADVLSDLLAEITDLYAATRGEVKNPVMLEMFGHGYNAPQLERVK
jgi:hypothetical protein